MKLILQKDVKHLGLVGDVVEVKEGYARNYLLPQNLALSPTPINIKQVELARVRAAEERNMLADQLRASAKRLAGTEITIRAAANEDGVLYGSVGPREIAAALRHEGHTVETEQVDLHTPIRHLDNVVVPVRFSDDLTVEVKVWVVRETASERLGREEAEQKGKEAHENDRRVGAVKED
jgi:large subunit ribosomal protein L9